MTSAFRLIASRTAALVLLVSLTGCASLYYAPKSDARASLRVTNTSSVAVAEVRVYDNPHCTGGGKPTSFHFTQRGESSMHEIDAGKPITFDVGGDRGSKVGIAISPNQSFSLRNVDIKQCLAPARFTPKPGGSYEAVYTDDGSHCAVEIFDIASGSRRPAQFVKLVWGRVPADNPRGNCAP